MTGMLAEEDYCCRVLVTRQGVLVRKALEKAQVEDECSYRGINQTLNYLHQLNSQLRRKPNGGLPQPHEDPRKVAQYYSPVNEVLYQLHKQFLE